MRHIPLALAVLALVLAPALAGCQSAQPSATYNVRADGVVSAGTRSAVDGSTAPGPQEIIGVYIPFVGTGLAARAALTWDGGPTNIVAPIGPFAAQQGDCLPSAASTPCAPQSSIQWVPRTRMVPMVSVPVPQAAGPCD